MKCCHVFAVVVILGCSVGCGSRAPDTPELGQVRGTVTLDGKLLPNVSVYFKPEEGRQSIAKTNQQGVYKAMYMIDEEGVKVGPCSVWLEWAPDDQGPAIPEKYGVNSELKFNVQPGQNEFDIDMQSGE